MHGGIKPVGKRIYMSRVNSVAAPPGASVRCPKRAMRCIFFTPNLPPVGGTFQFQIFIHASSLEIWRKTISGAEGGSGEEVGWPVFGLPPLEKIIGGVIALISFRQEAGCSSLPY